MIQETINRLDHLLKTIPALLNEIPETDIKNKPKPEKWSKQEILGHLIDSATNNHQRFVRAQFENEPTIIYDQNNWNTYNHYNKLSKEHVISFWTLYNKHLLEIIKHIPPQNLKLNCSNSNGEKVTLGWLINDYVIHMEYHLKQIVNFQTSVTKYPMDH